MKKIKYLIAKSGLDKSYLITLTASIVVAGIIFTSSFLINHPLWQGLFVSLGASVLAIGIAIIIVDYIRERRLESQYKIPRRAAFRRIVSMHSTLALTLAVNNRKNDESILRDILSRIEADQSAQSFLKMGSVKAIEKLAALQPNVILAGFSRKDVLGTLRDTIETIGKGYSQISDLYIFSFNNIPMRSAYVELLESHNTLVGSYSLAAIDEAELENLFRPVDPKEHGADKMTLESFLAVILIGYLKKYLEFLNLYMEEDEDNAKSAKAPKI